MANENVTFQFMSKEQNAKGSHDEEQDGSPKRVGPSGSTKRDRTEA